jgi:tubulin-specific chaperone A
LPVNIYTDIQRVNQIIKNLLSNSIKFTPNGGITVNIQRPHQDIDLSIYDLNPQETIAISIIDTGIGIPKDKQKLIFEAFQQVDGSTNRKYEGTGLGLSISRELAKLLGGGLRLESEEGKGTTFTLFLPDNLIEIQKQEPQKPSKKDEPAGTVEQQTQTVPVKEPDKIIPTDPPTGFEIIRDDRREIQPDDKVILVVEDDPNFAKILFGFVHGKGYKCLVAGDGETGLQFADYYKPSAIILDVSLPGIDGWTVMERLKDNGGTKNIPVHFITASEKRVEALGMGAIGFLTKPVNMEMLEGAFNKIENTISKNIRKLMIVKDDDERQGNNIKDLIDANDIKTSVFSTCQEAYDVLKSEQFDCIILDPLLADNSGFELLEKIKTDKTIPSTPIIIYSGKGLAEQEEAKLCEYAKHIVIKKAKSPEILLDECALFLHLLEENLSKNKQEKCKMIHDKESVFIGKKILIVDDDIRNVFAITSVLEGKGAKILTAQNGKVGLECLEKNQDIDLVLMDIMMPEMDGYEATKEIRKQERFKDLLIITLTAKAMRGDRNKCIEAGANDYIAKPVDTDKLLSVLRVWLYKDN